MFRRYLACKPDEAGRIGRLLDLVSNGPLGTGLFICWFEVLLGLGLAGALTVSAGIGRGCLACFSTSGIPSWMLGETALLLISAVVRGFGCGPLLDFAGSMQLLDSSHDRDRDKALLLGDLSG